MGDADLSALNDNHLTIMRRDHVGFVFQSFNPVPTISAPAILPSRRAAQLNILRGIVGG
jgi:predicted ABC-type transport system involved in lysophospholipase L1 biosynthesis ATPase subunit